MPPKKKGKKEPKSELQTNLEAFDKEEFVENSAAFTKVKDSLGN